MSSISAPLTRTGVSQHALSQAQRVLLLSFTVVTALLVYYFVGVDQGATSVFGKTLVLHEFVHDSRHFLGFPCH